MSKTAIKHSVENKSNTQTSSRALSPLDEFDRMMEGFFERNWMKPFFKDDALKERLGLFSQRNPKVDVIEREKEIIVRAEVSGIDRKELDVEVTEHSVTLKGQRSGETEEKKDEYFYSEIWQGSFSRTVALPAEVDAQNADANFKDGILTITLPKTKKTSRRKLEVK